MKRFVSVTAMAAMLALGAGGAAFAKPPLGQVAPIRDGLIAAGIAYEISEICPSLSARKLAGISYLLGLKSQARKMGYSNAEIDAFTDNKAEQDRLEALARKVLAQKGARKGDPESYCQVGRDEIQKRSVVGSLLR